MNAVRAVVALLLVTATPPAAAQEETQPLAIREPTTPEASAQPPAYLRDEQGRAMRVRFDPERRTLVGGGWAPRWFVGPRRGQGGPELGRGYLEVGVAHRYAIDGDDDGVSWKIYHHALKARVTVGESLQLEATGYRLRLLRHSEDGTLLWPSSPPRTLPFPFDIGFEVAVGQVAYRDLQGGYDADIGAVDAELRIDLWRRPELGSALQLGLGPRYDLWLSARPGSGPQPVQHLVTPFSGATLVFRHESADGHHAIDVEVHGAYRLRVDAHWAPWWEARAGYEAIVLALNDCPLSTYVESSYRHEADHMPAAPRDELRGVAGLRLSLPVPAAGRH